MAKTNENVSYSIKEAAELTGLSTVYIRRAILKGKLNSTKVQVGDTSVMRHEISASDLEVWRASVKAAPRREDGRGKFTLYATPEELQKIQDLLEKDGIESPLGRANKSKAKATEA